MDNGLSEMRPVYGRLKGRLFSLIMAPMFIDGWKLTMYKLDILLNIHITFESI